MIHSYLTLEYISLVIFGLILVIFSIGSFYLSNVDKKSEEKPWLWWKYVVRSSKIWKELIMNLNEYLIENDRHIGDVVLLFSVGTALDKVNGDTFPMLVGGKIGFDEPMNLMDMPISDDSKEWYDSLAFGEKEIVDEVMVDLSYEELVLGNE